MKSVDTHFLVLRAQAGDRCALDELLRTVQVELYKYLVGLLRDAHLAEDVLQDVFVIVCRKLRWLREPRFFRTWVYRIATREGMRRVRGRGINVSAESLDLLPDAEPSPEERALEREAFAKVLDQISELPPNSRAVVLLHYGAGLSLSAAAEVMGVPPGTAKSRLAYALSALRRTEEGGAP